MAALQVITDWREVAAAETSAGRATAPIWKQGAARVFREVGAARAALKSARAAMRVVVCIIAEFEKLNWYL